MNPTTVRRLLKIHRWTGLLAATNLGILVVTGVPLLFESEIEEVLGATPAPHANVTLAQVVDIARAAVPGDAVFVARSFGDYPGIVFVGMSSSGTMSDAVQVAVDTVHGVVTPHPRHDETLFGILWRIHTELLAGPRGMKVVGLIAVLFLISLSTGLCAYGSTMRNFTWQLFRSARPLRSAIADIHKITGISVLLWGLTVASTGVLLAWGVPQARSYGVQELTDSGPVQDDVSDIDAAVRAAESTRVKGRWWTILLPRNGDRYGVVMRGGPGLQKRVVTLARVEAHPPFTATSEALAEDVFRLGPIHFAEFGGLAVRIVWAAFGIGLLGLAASGLYMRGARF